MHQMTDIIQKKRDGFALSKEEIDWFIQEYTANRIPDYQVSALLMAIYFQNMTREETVNLTMAMAQSGHLMNLSDITDYAVDKHSSGGVGDKTTLIVLPLVATFGVNIAKMSGRGLGFSGGTLDKLESIQGYNVKLTEDEFRALARKNGIVLCGQTGELAPADGKLYALRDVTGTVPSLPLIASSIMSKKLASGANGIVLDVKCGNGAFMDTVEKARALAQTMVQIGVDAGRDMIAVLSDMNQPLGYGIGNALEVKDALATLHGGGAEDLREHCVKLAYYMLKLAGRGQQWTDEAETTELLKQRLDNGQAFDKFKLMISAQGGDLSMVEQPDRLPTAKEQITLYAEQSGYVQELSALSVAKAALALGAGRMKKEDSIDYAVGVEVFAKVGQRITKGEKLAIVHTNDDTKTPDAIDYLKSAFTFSADPTDPLPLFYDVLFGQ
jgi:pyrimidine-nucleoside phosphorylase